MSGIKNEINLGFKSKCLERIPATSANTGGGGGGGKVTQPNLM